MWHAGKPIHASLHVIAVMSIAFFSIVAMSFIAGEYRVLGGGDGIKGLCLWLPEGGICEKFYF